MTDLTKPEKKVLTPEQAKIVQAILEGIFPGGLGVHPPTLESAAMALQVASNLCGYAAALHEGFQVPWGAMCNSTALPATQRAIPDSAALLHLMLGPLHIDVMVPTHIRKGGPVPNFRTAAEGKSTLGE
jgi:hypothetical protein